MLHEFKAWFHRFAPDIKIRHLYLGKVCSSRDGLEKETEVIVSVIQGWVNAKDKFEHSGKKYPVVYKMWPENLLPEVSREGFEHDHDHDKMKKINNYLRAKAESIFREHSNVEMIRTSFFRIKDSAEEEKVKPEICIAIYCSCKGVVPVNEKEFPPTLDEFAIDIREGFFQLHGNYDICANSNDYLDPLRMGASISMGTGGTSYEKGTLGGFVQLDDGETGFITCAHVLHTENQMFQGSLNLQKPVAQPPEGCEGSQRCGFILHSVFPSSTVQNDDVDVSVDAAVVKLTTRTPKEALFADLKMGRLQNLGFSRDMPPKFRGGKIRSAEEARYRANEKVLKCGMRSGLTLGRLEIGEIFVRYRNVWDAVGENETIYKSQLAISGINTPFSTFEDSGALVFQYSDVNDLHCIGMIVGGGMGLSIATPIKAVLDALGVKLKDF